MDAFGFECTPFIFIQWPLVEQNTYSGITSNKFQFGKLLSDDLGNDDCSKIYFGRTRLQNHNVNKLCK